MKDIVDFQGAKATVHKFNFRIFTIVILAFSFLLLNACKSAVSGDASAPGSAETAATVNGKTIKMENVERAIKQQAQGQESKLSPLELAQARLQILEGLIQQEVMYQKAEKESLVPTDDQVTAEFNKRKTASGLSQEQFDKQMKDAGETDASIRETIKRFLATQALNDKVTGKVEPPKDSEIDAFYNGNKAAFVKKRGVKLAAIVIDPADNGEGDTTKNEQDAVLKANEIINQLKQPGADFAAIAREKSEDQSRLQGGDLGYISEEELKQNFPAQVAANLMDARFPIGQVMGAQMQGKYYILKLQERSDKDENLTLESPGIRQQVTDSLINARKQLLIASYQAIAMNEAKIENYLAKNVVDHPNELSGARPASAETPASNTNANPATNANVAANANTGAGINTNAVTGKPAANANRTK